ncbi:MAG: LptE family protein [Opitutus sp.]
MIFPRTVFAVLFALIGGGCGHYQLGTGGAPAFRTLYVEPVTNRTLLPQSQPIVTAQLRQAFIRDGRVTLVNSPAGADAILIVVISEYAREVAAAREDDTGLARKFDLTMGVTCTLRDGRTGANVWENRIVRTRREAFTDGGQLQSEYQVLPLLAASLAGKVLQATLDTW